MPFTIIDSAKKSVFIQQTYEKIEEAEARLAAVKAKFGARFQLEVAEIEEAGKPSAETKPHSAGRGKQSS